MFRFVPFSFSDKNIRIKQRRRKVEEIKIESSKKIRYNEREQKGTTKRGFNMTLVATQVKRRRGTNDENDAFAGAEGEITVDLTNKELRVHDGSGKKGGFRIGHYSYTSNCITQIPQDIKLELSNGTLTLKAGSVLTDPQGGTQRTTTEDKTGTLTINGQYMVFVDRNNGSLQLGSGYTVAKTGSGSALPADGTTFTSFYNTTDGKIYMWNGSTWIVWGVAFPIGVITVSGGAISRIDQIFNGFGFIGSTVFVLSGVKGLAPNGFNTDGTLKNNIKSVSNVLTNTLSGTYNFTLSCTGIAIGAYFYAYDVQTNQIIRTDTGAPYNGDRFIFGKVSVSNGRITSFATPKKVFHALDYNDTEYMVNQNMPDYSAGVSINNNTNYTCPKDGFLIATGYSSNESASNMLLNGSEIIRGIYNTAQYTYTPFILSVRKNDVVRVRFTGASVGQGIVFYPYKGA